MPTILLRFLQIHVLQGSRSKRMSVKFSDYLMMEWVKMMLMKKAWTRMMSMKRKTWIRMMPMKTLSDNSNLHRWQDQYSGGGVRRQDVILA